MTGTADRTVQPADRLIELLRHISERSLIDNGKLSGAVTRTIEQSNRPPVLGHWMCAILTAGPALRLTFRAHFLTASIRPIVGASLGKDPSGVGTGLIQDFVREFCNLTTGRLKRSLEKHGVDLGISIPLVVRGFDEVFTPDSDGKTRFHEAWTIETPVGTLQCSTYFEVVDPADLEFLTEDVKKALIAAESVTDQEIEFL